MSLSYEPIRDAICDVCHAIWMKGFAAANDGNVSVRLSDGPYAGMFLATPTGMSKKDVTPEKLVIIDENGKVLDGLEGYRPSSEIKMHLRCYVERPDVGAVVHAHPPVSTGFAAAGVSLDCYATIGTVLTVGTVPLAPYATPSTQEVPDSIAPLLKDHDALLLQNHGALTVGQDLTTAFYRMETLEMDARISLVAHLLGGSQEISPENISRLLQMRETTYHLPGRHPGYEHLDNGLWSLENPGAGQIR